MYEYREFKEPPCMGLSGDVDEHIMNILVQAKLRCTDSELVQRYDVAIASIGFKYLIGCESAYSPKVKMYRVHLKGERYFDVLAKDEDDAEAIVKNGSDMTEYEEVYKTEEFGNDE